MKSRQMGLIVDLKGRKVSELSVEEFYGLIELVFQHGVICVKNQKLDLSDELLPCISKIGNVIKLPAQFAFNNVQPDLPQISRIGNIKPDGTLVPGVKNAEYWHQDGDFWGFPKSFLIGYTLKKYQSKEEKQDFLIYQEDTSIQIKSSNRSLRVDTLILVQGTLMTFKILILPILAYLKVLDIRLFIHIPFYNKSIFMLEAYLIFFIQKMVSRLLLRR